MAGGQHIGKAGDHPGGHIVLDLQRLRQVPQGLLVALGQLLIHSHHGIGGIHGLHRQAQFYLTAGHPLVQLLFQALDRFVEMRAAEGAKMKADVENRLRFLEECVGRVETLSAGRVENYNNRLYEKLKVILEDRNIDDARVLTEAAIFGDKTAVDEETVRLRSHIAQYRSILELDEPVGRKLDFLTQELNRETNTIGSKCQDLDITRIVVDMKAEIEKIREQIQNLE